MKLLRCYLLLLVAFAAAVILTAMIPHRAIEDNCRASIAYVAGLDEYPQAFGLPLLKTDNFTDLLMLGEAWVSDDTRPVEASMMNFFYLPEGRSLFDASHELITHPVEQLQLTEYSRYWHGFQIVLRPLLVVADYSRLILANYILLTLLALWCLHDLWRLCSPSASILFGIVLLLVAFPAVPLCFQYSVCFYIMFLFVIALLRSDGIRRQEVCSFFTVGALTAFFDLLTTPLLTLGVPLLVYLGVKEKEAGNLKHTIRLSVSWVSGYAALWLSKCLVAWLLTGHNILGPFMEEVLLRSSLGLNIVRRLIMSHPILCTLTLFLGAALAFLVFRWARRNAFLSRNGWLLFVAAMPLIWYAALLQHSFIHFLFVWRILAITIMALLLLSPLYRKTLNCKP